MKNQYKIVDCLPYQCCPVCKGLGEVQPIWNIGANNACFIPCDVCNGKKIILMHVLKDQEEQEP